jgi:UDP-N-acetyl-D-mannosaminuronic acid dehydrogenase
VIGGLTSKCSAYAAALYDFVVFGECIITNARTAEMAKLTENSFRDVNIAFANEISMICDTLGINVWELVELANRHPRVNILKPSPGVGGHCIAVDPWFIVSKTPDQAQLIKTARQVNIIKPDWVISRINAEIGNFLQQNTARNSSEIIIALYGLTFKPDIDDLRESPALYIAKKLNYHYHGQLIIVEPNIFELPKSLDQSSLVEKEYAFEAADIHIMLVSHKEFMGAPKPSGNIVDACGIWE